MDQTIRQIPTEKCTGCGACLNKCPKNAIRMELNEEGFYFPTIDESLCVNCGLCLKTCPVTHPVAHHPTPQSYAVWASDEIRKESSSGGMFTLLADYVLSKRGVVFGARYAEDYMTVYHASAQSQETLLPLKKSKYVQSDTRLTYREAKQALVRGQLVLYTGCPCQIAGLYNYLGQDYENLITADIVCHGANSVTAYQTFLREFSDGKPIKKVDFRDKVHYNWSSPVVVYFADGSVKKRQSHESSWYEGFLKGIINRYSCFSCVYACPIRVADFTLADAWQVQRINPAYDDKRGTSLVLVNSTKGKALFSQLSDNMKLCAPLPFDEIRRYNGRINSSQKIHPARRSFFDYMQRFGYENAIDMVQGRKAPYDVGYTGWWDSTNYGSVLTSFAINRTLKRLGKRVLMLEYPNMSKALPEGKRYGIEFARQFYDISDITHKNDFRRFNALCDTFLVGSDQLWNYDNNKNFGVGYFFLDFVNNEKKKIAYATSFGKDSENYPESHKLRVGYYLSKFDAISVREKSGVDICRHSFGVDATHVLDPVFLCDMESYKEAIRLSRLNLNHKYVLSYILDVTPEKIEAVRITAKTLGLPYYIILDGQKDVERIKDELKDPGIVNPIRIEDWLNYFSNAQYVVTDSFHGFCYCLIFHRPMSVFANKFRGLARFETICELTGLQNRLVYSLEELISRDLTSKQIDFNSIDDQLQPMRQFSIEWLRNALERKKQSTPLRELQLWKTIEHERRLHKLEETIQVLEVANRTNVSNEAPNDIQKELLDIKQRLFALEKVFLSLPSTPSKENTPSSMPQSERQKFVDGIASIGSKCVEILENETARLIMEKRKNEIRE